MEQNMITIRNLSKEFKGQSVLKNITMEIPKNCVYGANLWRCWGPTAVENPRC